MHIVINYKFYLYLFLILHYIAGYVTSLWAAWPKNSIAIRGKRFLSSPECPDRLWSPL